MRACWQFLLLCRAIVALCCIGPAAAQTLAHKNWAGNGITVETWWTGAILYQIDPVSFQDSDGDGFGDLRGITQRLDYLQTLGVDAIVLSPFQLQAGFGRSASGAPFDPRDGTEQDLDQLIQEATRRRQRVFVDLPLDSSLTAQEQLNAARFWLSRGIAGLRLTAGDAAHPLPAAQLAERLRALRQLTATFAGQRVLFRDIPDGIVSRPAVEPATTTRRRSSHARRHQPAAATPAPTDVAQLAVDRRLLLLPKLAAADLRQALAARPAAAEPAPISDAPNHPRSLDRYEGGAHEDALAKILATALLAAPGAPLLYFGQEIGMATTPAATAGHAEIDPTPMQWGGDAGFTSGVPWTDMGRNAQTANVALEDADADSLLNWYRRLGALRHANPVLRAGGLEMVAQTNPDVVAWVRRLPNSATGSAPVLVVCNLSDHPEVVALGPDLRQMGLQTAEPMMHTLASTSLAASGVMGQEPLSGPVSVNNIVLPPFGVYLGELAHQAGLESAPAPVRHRPRAGSSGSSR